MSDINSQIAHRIEAFVTELSALVRASAVEAVSSAFGGEHNHAAARAVHPPKSKPADHAAKAKPPAHVAKRTPKPASKARPGHRTPEQIAATVAKVFDYIKAHPKTRSGLIREALTLQEETMRDTLHRLKTAKKIKVSGTKRGATWSIA